MKKLLGKSGNFSFDNMPKNFWFKKKVFITGHTGFKGSWLSIWLISKGANIYGYSLAPPKDISLFNSLNLDNYAKEKNCEFNNFYGDIRDKNLLEKQIETIKPDLVLHLAAQPIVRDSYIDP